MLEGARITDLANAHRGQPDRPQRPHLPAAGAAVRVPVHARRQLRGRHPVVERPRHRRRRLHRLELRPLGARAHPDWHITTLDKLTYAGRLENLRDVDRQPAAPLRARATSPTRAVAGAARARRPTSSCTSRPRRTSIDRFIAAGDFIHTDVFGTFVLLEAAREATALRRFVQISTDEVYGSVPDRAQPRDRRAAAAQSVLGEQGRRRPAGLQLLGDLRRAGDRHARVEQLRAESVSRESDSALHHQRDRQPRRCRSTATA